MTAHGQRTGSGGVPGKAPSGHAGGRNPAAGVPMTPSDLGLVLDALDRMADDMHAVAETCRAEWDAEGEDRAVETAWRCQALATRLRGLPS